jgi:hypothetical protein
MRNLIHVLTIAVTLLIASCATSPVSRTAADYDRSADFSAYRTFGFFETLGTDAAGYESLVTQALKSATRREMEARGYAYAETGADLLINFNAKLAQQTRVSQTSAPPMYYGYRRGYYGGWSTYGYGTQTHVDQYTEGTLNIDIVDANRKQLVWEGVAIGRVTDKVRQNREAAINAAVAEVFAKYPFRAGGG